MNPSSYGYIGSSYLSTNLPKLKVMIVIDVILYAFLLAAIWFAAVVTILFLVYGNEFKRLWLEPVLRYPVVIFESDDWGVGPENQNSALSDLLSLFLQYHDQHQHHPVLTLGLVLAEPDVEKICQQNNNYYRRDLSDNKYTDLVNIIKKGHEKGVFSLHLHGMEHFWPDSLMKSTGLKGVDNWLFDSKSLSTEELPSYLQSRWCDTSILPSTPLGKLEIEEAVDAEKTCFIKVFGQEPKVVVPPTFVWTDSVINAYASHDIHIFVTPGKQYTGRDAQGKIQSNGRTFYNGDRDKVNNALYLVRDVYFEPDLGHKADDVLNDIISRARCGRPALLEMHRFNFLANKAQSLSEVKRLLDVISNKLPETLFLSAEKLANIYYAKDADVLFLSVSERFPSCFRRAQLLLSNKRLAKYSGFNKILFGFCRLG